VIVVLICAALLTFLLLRRRESSVPTDADEFDIDAEPETHTFRDLAAAYSVNLDASESGSSGSEIAVGSASDDFDEMPAVE